MRRPAVADRSETIGTLVVVAAVVIIGCAPRLIAVAERHSEPLTLSMLRVVPAAAGLVLALPLLRSRLPGRELWPAILGTGLLLAVFFECLTEAVARAGPGTAVVLASTVPLWVALLARIFLREQISLGALLGLLVGFSGVTMIVSSELGGEEGGTQLALGMILALIAAFSGGASTVTLRELSIKHPDLDVVAFTAGQLLVAGTVLIALSLGIDGTGGADWSSAELWGAVAFISIGATAIASVAFLAGLKRLDATRASAWLFLSPVVTVLIEIVLGVTPATLVLVGMALTVAGIAIVNRPPSLTRRSPKVEA